MIEQSQRDDFIKKFVKYDQDTGCFSIIGKTKEYGLRGFVRKDGYIEVSIKSKRYLAHRLAWLLMTGEWPALLIDHINLQKADNRWENLRPASKAMNMANIRAHRDGCTGLKGVTFDKDRKRYRAQIMTNGRQNYLGLFDCPAAASFAYQIAAVTKFGEYGRAF